MGTATQVLAFKYEENLLGYVRARLERFGSAIYEEVAEVSAHDAVVAAIGFRGESLPEFGGLVYKIAYFRIQDFHRKGKIDTTPLYFLDDDGELKPRDVPVPDRTEEIAELSVKTPLFMECYERLNEKHREVIKLVRFRELPHKDVAGQINRQFGEGTGDPMTDQNVSKIDSRFGKCLEKLLDEAEGATDDDG